MHVHDDEPCAPRRRPSGPRALRARVAGVHCLCQRPAAGPLAHGRQDAWQACRSDHRPPRRTPHAAHPEGVRRGRSRAVLPHRARNRQRAHEPGRDGAAALGGPHRISHADREGFPDRRLDGSDEPRRADPRRRRLHPGDRRRAVDARRTHHADLRRHQRHPGSGPARTQGVRYGRQERADDHGAHQGGDRQVRSAARGGAARRRARQAPRAARKAHHGAGRGGDEEPRGGRRCGG